jgi:hypothetical protein
MDAAKGAVMFGLATHHAIMVAGGWVLFAIGVLGAPLPLHPGFPFLALGGIILVGRSRRFRRWAATLRAWFPKSSNRLTARCRNWPRALRYLVLRTDPRRVLGRERFARPCPVQLRARGWALR